MANPPRELHLAMGTRFSPDIQNIKEHFVLQPKNYSSFVKNNNNHHNNHIIHLSCHTNILIVNVDLYRFVMINPLIVQTIAAIIFFPYTIITSYRAQDNEKCETKNLLQPATLYVFHIRSRLSVGWYIIYGNALSHYVPQLFGSQIPLPRCLARSLSVGFSSAKVTRSAKGCVQPWAANWPGNVCSPVPLPTCPGVNQPDTEQSCHRMF